MEGSTQPEVLEVPLMGNLCGQLYYVLTDHVINKHKPLAVIEGWLVESRYAPQKAAYACRGRTEALHLQTITYYKQAKMWLLGKM